MRPILKTIAAGLHLVMQGLVRAAKGIWSLLGPGPGWSGLGRWLLQAATLGILAGVGGLLFAASGLAPIGASSGHWPITEWFLSFSMSRSVATHSLGIKVPPLDDSRLVLKGATYYETGCFPCHGSPVIQHPRIAQAMTPHPPYLPPAIHEWEPQELFYIVKHGVKFTGMPAWPTQQRDDEVWAMVAFLQKFPELDAQEYRRLAHGGDIVTKEDAPLQALTGPDATPRVITHSCQRCHGLDGKGRGSAFPKLNGQQPEYLEASLEAYALGQRHSGIMEPIAAGLSRAEMHDIARYYARLGVSKTVPETPEPDGKTLKATSSPQASDAVRRGTAIAQEGVPHQRIAICAECHGPADPSRKSAYPTLAGQYADYLVLQLELFAKRQRGGTKYAHLMHPIADRLTPQQKRDVAQYYESLSASAESPTR
jgi:cytochrome c553